VNPKFNDLYEDVAGILGEHSEPWSQSIWNIPTIRWNYVPFQILSESTNIGCVSFHASGIEKVEFYVNDVLVKTRWYMEYNSESENDEYWFTLDPSLYTPGETLKITAISYSCNGTQSTLDRVDPGTGFNPTVLYEYGTLPISTSPFDLYAPAGSQFGYETTPSWFPRKFFYRGESIVRSNIDRIFMRSKNDHVTSSYDQNTGQSIAGGINVEKWTLAIDQEGRYALPLFVSGGLTTEQVRYVDRLTGPGGDGSQGNPYQQIPTGLTQANYRFILKTPGIYQVRPDISLTSQPFWTTIEGTSDYTNSQFIMCTNVDELGISGPGSGTTGYFSFLTRNYFPNNELRSYKRNMKFKNVYFDDFYLEPEFDQSAKGITKSWADNCYFGAKRAKIWDQGGVTDTLEALCKGSRGNDGYYTKCYIESCDQGISAKLVRNCVISEIGQDEWNNGQSGLCINSYCDYHIAEFTSVHADFIQLFNGMKNTIWYNMVSNWATNQPYMSNDGDFANISFVNNVSRTPSGRYLGDQRAYVGQFRSTNDHNFLFLNCDVYPSTVLFRHQLDRFCNNPLLQNATNWSDTVLATIEGDLAAGAEPFVFGDNYTTRQLYKEHYIINGVWDGLSSLVTAKNAISSDPKYEVEFEFPNNQVLPGLTRTNWNDVKLFWKKGMYGSGGTFWSLVGNDPAVAQNYPGLGNEPTYDDNVVGLSADILYHSSQSGHVVRGIAHPQFNPTNKVKSWPINYSALPAYENQNQKKTYPELMFYTTVGKELFTIHGNGETGPWVPYMHSVFPFRYKGYPHYKMVDPTENFEVRVRKTISSLPLQLGVKNVSGEIVAVGDSEILQFTGNSAIVNDKLQNLFVRSLSGHNSNIAKPIMAAVLSLSGNNYVYYDELAEEYNHVKYTSLPVLKPLLGIETQQNNIGTNPAYNTRLFMFPAGMTNNINPVGSSSLTSNPLATGLVWISPGVTFESINNTSTKVTLNTITGKWKTSSSEDYYITNGLTNSNAWYRKITSITNPAGIPVQNQIDIRQPPIGNGDINSTITETQPQHTPTGYGLGYEQKIDNNGRPTPYFWFTANHDPNKDNSAGQVNAIACMTLGVLMDPLAAQDQNNYGIGVTDPGKGLVYVMRNEIYDEHFRGGDGFGLTRFLIPGKNRIAMAVWSPKSMQFGPPHLFDITVPGPSYARVFGERFTGRPEANNVLSVTFSLIGDPEPLTQSIEWGEIGPDGETTSFVGQNGTSYTVNPQDFNNFGGSLGYVKIVGGNSGNSNTDTILLTFAPKYPALSQDFSIGFVDILNDKEPVGSKGTNYAQVNDVISVTFGSVGGYDALEPDAVISSNYQWFRDGDPIAANGTSASYTLTAADVNTSINCELTVTNPDTYGNPGAPDLASVLSRSLTGIAVSVPVDRLWAKITRSPDPNISYEGVTFGCMPITTAASDNNYEIIHRAGGPVVAMKYSDDGGNTWLNSDGFTDWSLPLGSGSRRNSIGWHIGNITKSGRSTIVAPIGQLVYESAYSTSAVINNINYRYIWYSDDGGKTWEKTTAIPTTVSDTGYIVYATKRDKNIFATTYNGSLSSNNRSLWFSTDNGQTWTPMNPNNLGTSTSHIISAMNVDRGLTQNVNLLLANISPITQNATKIVVPNSANNGWIDGSLTGFGSRINIKFGDSNGAKYLLVGSHGLTSFPLYPLLPQSLTGSPQLPSTGVASATAANEVTKGILYTVDGGETFKSIVIAGGSTAHPISDSVTGAFGLTGIALRGLVAASNSSSGTPSSSFSVLPFYNETEGEIGFIPKIRTGGTTPAVMLNTINNPASSVWRNRLFYKSVDADDENGWNLTNQFFSTTGSNFNQFDTYSVFMEGDVGIIRSNVIKPPTTGYQYAPSNRQTYWKTTNKGVNWSILNPFGWSGGVTSDYLQPGMTAFVDIIIPSKVSSVPEDYYARPTNLQLITSPTITGGIVVEGQYVKTPGDECHYTPGVYSGYPPANITHTWYRVYPADYQASTNTATDRFLAKRYALQTLGSSYNTRANDDTDADTYIFVEEVATNTSGTVISRSNIKYVTTPDGSGGSGGGDPPTIDITTQPTDSTVDAPNGASFTVAATLQNGSGTLQYQWQKAPFNGSFVNISGANSPTLTISSTTYVDDQTQYRCVITASGLTVTKTSNTAVLNVNYATVEFQIDPQDTTVVAPNVGTFGARVDNEDATLQWQEKQGTAFEDILGENADNLEYPYPTTTALSGKVVRCKATPPYGPDVFSNEATLTVLAATITITNQPTSTITRTAPDGFDLNVLATSTNLLPVSYQWQLSGGSFSDITNETSTTLSIASTITGDNNKQYRCQVTVIGADNPVNSNTSTLTVNSPTITINSQPQSPFQTLVGNDVSFDINASTDNNSVLNYQWQLSGGSFSDILGGIYSGTASNELSFVSSVGLSGNQYRCRITSPYNSTPSFSNIITLLVPDPTLATIVSTDPQDYSVIAPYGANFSINAQASNQEPVIYQWQLSGGSWSDLEEANSSSYVLNATVTGDDGKQYRCKVTALGCSDLYTNHATLSVTAGTMVFANQPSPIVNTIAFKPGGESIFVDAFTTSGQTIIANWERSTNGGSIWTTVLEDAEREFPQSGGQRFRYPFEIGGTGTSGHLYRAYLTAPFTISATSQQTLLQVDAATIARPTLIVSNSTPRSGYPFAIQLFDPSVIEASTLSQLLSLWGPDVSAAELAELLAGWGQEDNLVMRANNGKIVNFQWQRGPSAGSLSDISGETGSFLIVDGLTTGAYAEKFSCTLTADGCLTVTADTVQIFPQIADRIQIVQHPASVSVTEPDTANFSIIVQEKDSDDPLSFVPTYQWQFRTSHQGDFANIASGSTSFAYSTSTSVSMNGYQYRCVVGANESTSTESNFATLTVTSAGGGGGEGGGGPPHGGINNWPFDLCDLKIPPTRRGNSTPDCDLL